jgi:hypothetical protein
MKQQFEVIVTHLRTLQIRYGRSTDPGHFICRATDQPLEAPTISARPGR